MRAPHTRIASSVWIASIAITMVTAGTARAEPTTAREAYRRAAQLDADGDDDQALARIDDGLAVAPRDLSLLGLKGEILLKLRDYAGALAAYQAYLAAGPAGASRRNAMNIVNNLRAAGSTTLDISVANGPADVYLDSKAQGLFCTASPSCKKAMLPGDYKVIAERAGFQRWTGRVVIASGQAAKLAITLIDKPSPLTVHVTPESAQITVDGAPFNPAVPVPAGPHHIAAALEGHVDAQGEVVASAGAPIAVELVLTPIVPVRVLPADAALMLDGQPVALDRGGLAFAPGAHTLVARARGYVDRSVAIAAEREAGYAVALTLDAIPVPLPPAPVDSIWHGRKLIALSAAGAGAIGVGVGVGFGAAARSTHERAASLCGASLVCTSSDEFARAHQLVLDARSQANVATVLTAAGGAALAAAVIVWVTAPSERRMPAPQVVPSVGDHSAVLNVVGRF